MCFSETIAQRINTVYTAHHPPRCTTSVSHIMGRARIDVEYDCGLTSWLWISDSKCFRWGTASVSWQGHIVLVCIQELVWIAEGVSPLSFQLGVSHSWLCSGMSCSLQRTATHCNALQRTATHCNTLQHTATQCNALQHTATHRNTPQHTPTPRFLLIWVTPRFSNLNNHTQYEFTVTHCPGIFKKERNAYMHTHRPHVFSF